MLLSRSLAIIACLVVGHAAYAWNALGHKTVAEIAWRQLKVDERHAIADAIRRHPRFADDFFKKMPADVETADKATQDQWIFQHAATWPDIARGITGSERKQYDRGTWHYVNAPIFVSADDRSVMTNSLVLNLSVRYPTELPEDEWNVIQATKHAQSVVRDRQSPAPLRAVAICWLMHLTGDAHQPMHSCALFSVNRYPKGDRGGNDIPLLQGTNLHSLWDNLLGRQDRLNDVQREVVELSDRGKYGDIWTSAAKETDVRRWLVESFGLAKSFAYDDAILQVIRRATPSQPIERITLSDNYLKAAGQHARKRVLAAGLRLAVALDGYTANEQIESEFDAGTVRPPVTMLAPTSRATPAANPKTSAPLTHWLNTKTGVRHNSSCRWYGTTSSGRSCSADEGKACGQCGG